MSKVSCRSFFLLLCYCIVSVQASALGEPVLSPRDSVKQKQWPCLGLSAGSFFSTCSKELFFTTDASIIPIFLSPEESYLNHFTSRYRNAGFIALSYQSPKKFIHSLAFSGGLNHFDAIMAISDIVMKNWNVTYTASLPLLKKTAPWNDDLPFPMLFADVKTGFGQNIITVGRRLATDGLITDLRSQSNMLMLSAGPRWRITYRHCFFDLSYDISLAVYNSSVLDYTLTKAYYLPRPREEISKVHQTTKIITGPSTLFQDNVMFHGVNISAGIMLGADRPGHHGKRNLKQANEARPDSLRQGEFSIGCGLMLLTYPAGFYEYQEPNTYPAMSVTIDYRNSFIRGSRVGPLLELCYRSRNNLFQKIDFGIFKGSNKDFFQEQFPDVTLTNTTYDLGYTVGRPFRNKWEAGRVSPYYGISAKFQYSLNTYYLNAISPWFVPYNITQDRSWAVLIALTPGFSVKAGPVRFSADCDIAVAGFVNTIHYFDQKRLKFRNNELADPYDMFTSGLFMQDVKLTVSYPLRKKN